MLVEPAGGGHGTGALVLSGSSGRVEAGRARLLARHGVAALSVRWFGGDGQPPGICEVPLETFVEALDRLATIAERLAVIGVSKGAEAALLTAVHDPRVAVVAAFAPPHVVWGNVGPGRDGATRPVRSSWTLRGEPLPFVPYDDDWAPDRDPPAFRGLYRASLERYGPVPIPVERIAGRVILAAGEDDQVWASADFARAIADRRAAHGRDTTVVTHPRAGHRLVLPGEEPPPGRTDLAHGGSPEADAELGGRVWAELAPALDIRP